MKIGKDKLKTILNVLYPLISIGIIFFVWYLLALAIDLEIILPKPSYAFAALGKVLAQSEFYTAVGFTLLRSLVSFLIAFIVALAFAILSKINVIVRKILSPLVSVVRSIPTMSIILLALIWLTSEYAPLIIAFIVIFPTLYAGIYSAFDSLDSDLLDMARTYKVKKKYVVWKLIVPTVSPSVLISSASSLSLNMKLVIAAEALAQTGKSLGNLMQISKVYLETSYLLAYTMVAVFLGLILEILIYLLKKKTERWKNA